MGTESPGVIEAVGEPAVVVVCVTRGEEVAVIAGVDTVTVDEGEGVKIACNVNAAAV